MTWSPGDTFRDSFQVVQDGSPYNPSNAPTGVLRVNGSDTTTAVNVAAGTGTGFFHINTSFAGLSNGDVAEIIVEDENGFKRSLKGPIVLDDKVGTRSAHNAADVRNEMDANSTELAAIRGKTDEFSFSSGDVVATLDGEVVTVGANNDKSGYGLASNAITDSVLANNAVAKIEAALLNEGDGQALIDAIVQAVDSADISTNLTVALIRDGILNRVLAGNHETAGTMGKILLDAATQALAQSIKSDTQKLPSNPAGVGSEMNVADDGIGASSIEAGALNGKGDWSTHSPAQVRTALEVDGSKLDHLWETTEDDSGVRRFTANALEQAPTASGGGSSTDPQVIRDAMALALSDGITIESGSVDDKLAAASSNPTGPYTTTITVLDESNSPLENAAVAVTSSGVDKWRGETDATGQLIITQSDATYTVGATLTGYQQKNTPQTYTVAGADQSVSVVMEEVVIPPSSTPGFCNCVLKALDITGTPNPGASVRFQMAELPGNDQVGELWTSAAEVTADADGNIETTLPQSAKVRYAEVNGNLIGPWTVAVVPDENAAELPSVLGLQP